jgi:hypothetical protein
MNIANPIYDAVFKQLMSNMHIARFFISTILEETVVEVAVSQQELAYDKDGNPAGRSVPVAIFRLDFVATIKTASGEYKKVLIEIQKTRKYIDLMRFRNYLGEHYKRKDEVYTDGGKLLETLPIVTIYLLGFELKKIMSAAIKVNREYIDLVTHAVINAKDEFIEKLTHDCYVVQIPRIEGKLQTKLEKLLTIFEQKYFVDETGDVKEYNYPIDDDDIKMIADALHFACTDPESRRRIEAERESFRVFNVALEQQTLRLNETIMEKDKALEEKNKALEEKDKALQLALQELAALKKGLK